MPLNIVADENIPQLDEWFAPLGKLRKLAGRDMTAEQVADADVLLVRSVTPVNQHLLANSRVRFVGTATIGTDHIDTAWLDAQAIRWASAPGSNATSVVEYVLAALCEVDDVLECLLAGGVVGIVGGGNVGSRLCQRLQALGITVQVYDPFLTAASGLPLVCWEQILSAEVLCLHTPLTRSGAHPTYHLFDERVLQAFSGTLLLNAGRGAVVDNPALRDWLSVSPRHRAVLDVWENEPAIDGELFSRVVIGTPHIAGYSLDGKLAGSWQLYQALSSWYRQIAAEPLPVAKYDVSSAGVLDVSSLDSDAALIRYVMRAVYPLHDDHRRLAEVLQLGDDIERRHGFDALRKNYPVRREIAAYRIGNLPQLSATARHILLALGFRG